tara:strand:- start:352 stop:612 length:261 start_codon:yes stop_codon:yes gene_type:complete
MSKETETVDPNMLKAVGYDPSFIKLEDAIEIVLSAARSFRSGVPCPESILSKTMWTTDLNAAINVVEDFFVNNVFEGVEDDSNSND